MEDRAALTWQDLIRPAVANDNVMAIVEQGVEAGAFELWEGEGCAAVCQRVKTFDVWFAGGDLKGLKELCAKAEADAAADGCDRVMFSGRKEWARALDGYRVVTVLVKDLR